MSLVDEVKKYKYVGMPFHSPKFPNPVYSHLIASNDGFNWKNLKDYNWGWRDVDIKYINGLWWVCYTTSICYSIDLENFTEIPFPHPQFNSVWAPELFKDKDGQWYLIYCGGNGKDDDWHIYMQKFNPNEKKLDEEVLKVNINENANWIDANLNYINGYYYLWTCYSTTFPHELRLYKSSSLLGTYERVQTNITDRVKEAGMVIDEAPEMLYKDGRYILYSDPYYHGLPELDRCVQYSISRDMTNWSSLAKVSCTGDYNPRHFTPYYIGDINFNGNDNTNVDNSNSSLNNINFNLWNGDPNLFYKTNLDNFTLIQNFIDSWNKLSKSNNILEPISVSLDINDYKISNRSAYRQFIDNSNKVNSFIIKYCNTYNMGSDFITIIPKTPYDTDFNKDKINQYWKDLQQDFNFLVAQANNSGKVEYV